MSMEELVAWLGSMGLDPDRPDEESTAEEPQQTREARKFRRLESAAAKAARVAAARSHQESAALAEEPSADASLLEDGALRTEDGAVMPELTPRGERRVDATGAGLFSNVVAQCAVLVLMALCFVLGRMTLPARPSAVVQGAASAAAGKEAAVTKALPGPAMEILDQALAAQNNGDPRKAVQLLEPLRGGGQHINGLDYELGWLAYRSEDYPAALLAVNRSIAEGEQIGESYDLRGLIAGGRLPGQGLFDFEAAARANPFEATPFFHWGEALRRAGKPREALGRLQQALDRAQNQGARMVYELKIRLTKIELGEEKDFAPALAAALARPEPAPEWLLTAAAEELHSGNYPAAAATLERAGQPANLPLLNSALRDYFFLGFAEKAGLANVYSRILGQPGATSPAAAPGLPAVSLPSPLAAPMTNRGPGQ